MNSLPRISVVVLGYNNKDITIECIESLYESTAPVFEILYIDNGSNDGAEYAVESLFPTVRVIALPRNLMYTKGMNAGILRTSGDLIMLLTNDTVVDSECMKEIIFAMRDTRIGCVTPKLLRYGTNKLDMAVCKLGFMGMVPYSVGYGDEDNGQCDRLAIDYASGCAMVLRASVLQKVGILDEGFPLFWSDVDLSLRIKKAGYRIEMVPRAKVWHRGGASVKKAPSFKVKCDINSGRVKMLVNYMKGRY